MREWFLSTELMDMDEMPGSTAGISQRARRENWKSRKAKGGGRSLEYHLSNFPIDVQYQLYCQEYGYVDKKAWELEMKMLHAGAVDACDIEAIGKAAENNEGMTLPEDLPSHLALYTSLSKELGTPEDIIQSWAENGVLAENVKVARTKIAKKSEAMGNFNQEVNPSERPISLDFYDIDVSAGPGALALQEHTADPITFNKDFLTNSLEVLPEDVFLMPVRGDSMQPTLKNQAIIMVKKIDLFATDGIYVFRFDGQLMVKRLQFSKTGLSVVSDNPSYKEWEITREETENVDFEILGEVIWSGQRL